MKGKNADKIQTEIFRRMGPEARLRLAGHMYDFAKRIIAQESGEKVYERVRRTARKNGSRTIQYNAMQHAEISKLL